MTIRNISLHIDYDSGYEEDFKIAFNSDSRFISNYLSKQVRKLKISTDGSYNMISISPSKEIKFPCRIVGEKSLQTRIKLDKDLYFTLNKQARYDYYLQLLEQGYELANHYFSIPVKELVVLNTNLKKEGYKNEWLHKRKIFKDYNLKVELHCGYTSDDFKLNIQVETIKERTKLVSGTIFRTAPYEVSFQPLFKDILLDNGSLIITEVYDRPKVILSLDNIFKNKLSFDILDNGLEYEPYSR